MKVRYRGENIHEPLGNSYLHSQPKGLLPKMNQSTVDSFLQRRTPTGGERFLFPMLKYGPNNQFLCLMQCAKLAKDTHRTLVLPVLQALCGFHPVDLDGQRELVAPGREG